MARGPEKREVVPRPWHTLLDILFPPQCAGCGKSGVNICPDCMGQVTPVPLPICRHCGRPWEGPGVCHSCRSCQSQLKAIRSASIYAQPLGKIIWQFKYRNRRDLARPLGGLLASYWMGHVVPVDIVMAVPLHPTRQRERGYNQATLLAQQLCFTARLPLLDAGILQRGRPTTQQASLTRPERLKNVAGAFQWQGPALSDLNILLIDDVATSGATLEACATVLKGAGAASVRALTVARAGDEYGKIRSSKIARVGL
ncbi:MAG: ComF family protein [Chloroflexota bacterium]|nr:ComF family protein [Chloroflexota bacterium]